MKNVFFIQLFILLLSLFSQACAGERFVLSTSFGDMSVYFFLNDSNNRFRINAVNAAHDSHIISSQLFSGIYQKKGDSILMQDSLWMQEIILLREGKDYRITKAPLTLVGKYFKFKNEFEDYIPTALEKKNMTGFIDLIHLYDSVRTDMKNLKQSHSNFKIKKGVFKCAYIGSRNNSTYFTIELQKRNRYCYKLNDETLFCGKWSQHGNYLVFCHEKQNYYIQIIAERELDAVYFPFLDIGYYRLNKQ